MARTHICIYYMNIIFIHLFIYIHIHPGHIYLSCFSISCFIFLFTFHNLCFMFHASSSFFSLRARGRPCEPCRQERYSRWNTWADILPVGVSGSDSSDFWTTVERHGYFLLDVWWRFRHLFHWFGAGPTTQRDSPVSQGCGGNALRPMTFEEPVCIDLFIIIMVSSADLTPRPRSQKWKKTKHLRILAPA